MVALSLPYYTQHNNIMLMILMFGAVVTCFPYLSSKCVEAFMIDVSFDSKLRLSRLQRINSSDNERAITTTRRRTIIHKKPPKKKISGSMSEEELKAFFDEPGNVPANLRRTVNAKRPTLGHVVPKVARDYQKEARKRAQQQQGSASGGRSGPKLRSQGIQRQRDINNPSNLKILGGTFKGKRLISPDVFLRPMMGKVREAVYSTIASFGLYDEDLFLECHHLDIFSGSGSVGLESLSRGATTCTFVDLAPNCCDSIKQNLNLCGLGHSSSSSTTTQSTSFSRSNNNNKEPTTTTTTTTSSSSTRTNQIVCADALQALRQPDMVGISSDNKYQIVTICPPYEEVVYGDLLHAVANSPLVTEDTIVLLEYPYELGCLPHVYKRDDGGTLIGIRNRKYGRTVIAMYIVNPTGRLELASSRPEEFVSL